MYFLTPQELDSAFTAFPLLSPDRFSDFAGNNAPNREILWKQKETLQQKC